MLDVYAQSGITSGSVASACGVASPAGVGDSTGAEVGVAAGAGSGVGAAVGWAETVGGEVGAGSVESPPDPPHACNATKAAARSAIAAALDLPV